ncbi:Crp/Fnr family transcriptional regulator [Pedobacter sp. MC2016-24]|uniref:Crp/Fnr family transcriptional regulator n=1 Tax=Pedobacter sp. MC2016-24 TaxID=2780090 RepID=UPI00187E642E|nr:Crp/Fnr family transcriptional regulator [Pedobacter sp. MC2016-24]MBE9600863.1 Crp/Fnr family transcriptional regulator [Pedobacter sp. MC2016-24]
MSLKGIFPIDHLYFTTQFALDVLSADDYHALITQQEQQKYKKGEIIYKEGVKPSGLFFIHQGKVKKYKVDQYGREHVLYITSRDELVGYHAVLAEERYSDSMAALQSSIISFIPMEDFMGVLNRSPLFARHLLKLMSQEITVFANKLSIFGQRTAVERLAIALIILREKFKIDTAENEEITIDISRTDLAGIAGIAKENVIRILKEFKSEEIIATEGRKIFVLDIKKLVLRSNYK